MTLPWALGSESLQPGGSTRKFRDDSRRHQDPLAHLSDLR